MHPNHEVAVGLNPYYKKINLGNFEYKIFDKQVVYSDQPSGAVHPVLYQKEEKIIKVGTILQISLTKTHWKNIIIVIFLSPEPTVMEEEETRRQN